MPPSLRCPLLILAATLAWPAASAADLPPGKAPGEIVAAAPAEAWVAIDPDDLLVIDLASGQRIVIELAPRFAPAHVANIKTLARARFFDGTSVNRVQDDYVAQWGDATEKKPLPAPVKAKLPAEYDRPAEGLAMKLLGYADPYAEATGFGDGWPIGTSAGRAWLTHCYGMVGVGRDMPPDVGNGAELYAVIGHAPRHLDRNIALVGRVIDGIEALSALPRGTGDLGFYKTAGERVPITRVRIAADMPAAARPAYQHLRQDAPAFAAYAQARASRTDAFFIRPAGGIDVCNVPVPVRSAR